MLEVLMYVWNVAGILVGSIVIVGSLYMMKNLIEQFIKRD